jgi:extracellular factor (EF) 3-hydroxypalmitic acid methyl ester biosynthesis protein
LSAKDSNLQEVAAQAASGLNAEYKEVVDDLRAFLERVRSDMEHEEGAGMDRKSLFKAFGPTVFKKLNESIAELEKVSEGLDEAAQKAHMEYLQGSIHHVALESPFNKRCFEKPRGYPGDYLTMEMIYSDPCQGETTFAQILNFHSLMLPIAEAVRERRRHIKEMILDAHEVREVLEALPGSRARFFLLDQDKEALEYSRKRLDGQTAVFFIHKPVIKLAREDLGMKFDFIYCMGIFDYLSDIFAKRLVRRLYGLLEDGGRLVIGNASHNPNRIWMEHGSEWHLVYRDEEALLRLSDGLDMAQGHVHIGECDDIGRMFLSLVIDK